MSWRDYTEPSAVERVLPWVGGSRVFGHSRAWRVAGGLPPEEGWYRFRTQGLRAIVVDVDDVDLDYGEGQSVVRGYLVGDRFIADTARVDPNHFMGLVQQTQRVHIVPLGLGRFARATCVVDPEGRLVYWRQELPTAVDDAVLAAYQDRKGIVDLPSAVSPALDLTFRWITLQRGRAEAARAALEAKRQEEERRAQAMRDVGTGAGRRHVAQWDFPTAAAAALKVSGAVLLDTRPSRARGEMVVQYRFRRRRFECVVDAKSLRVIEAGVCLTDHDSGVRGDTFFTLESLPAVVGEAMDEDSLVVWRHV